MKKTVKTADVRSQLGDLLDRVSEHGDEYVIERRGKPLAAIVSVERLARMEKASELRLLEALDRQARKLALEQVDQVAQKAKKKSRQGRS